MTRPGPFTVSMFFSVILAVLLLLFVSKIVAVRKHSLEQARENQNHLDSLRNHRMRMERETSQRRRSSGQTWPSSSTSSPVNLKESDIPHDDCAVSQPSSLSSLDDLGPAMPTLNATPIATKIGGGSPSNNIEGCIIKPRPLHNDLDPVTEDDVPAVDQV